MLILSLFLYPPFLFILVAAASRGLLWLGDLPEGGPQARSAART